ncbi:MAG TPA: hypothetical protein VMP12_01855 [Candidatus Sulfotelmatobacter sp.]|nr:hypothetical protein [Candidatus Sulfotelmatobacter sp.]
MAAGFVALASAAVSAEPKARGAAATPAASAPIKVPMTAEHWQTESGAFEKIQGMDALAMHEGGTAIAKEITLKDGTIEFDVQPMVMGTGMVFRRQDEKTFEMFYFRPDGKCSQSPYCVQYAPETHNILLWDVFPQYQGPAPVRDGEWNHVKIVLSGKRMNMYVNHSATPTLKVGRLEGDTSDGAIGLSGPGYFANFVVIPDATEGLSPEPEADPTATDAHLVRDWQLSPVSELAAGKDPSYGEMPATPSEWKPIGAELGGLIDITREYGLPLDRPKRSMAWIKTTVNSDKAQTIHTSIGWVREVWVFVNGKQVFADKNLFMPASARKNPAGRLALTNGSFDLPLNAGANEVAIAVASNFYGLGVILRPDSIEGLRFAGK